MSAPPEAAPAPRRPRRWKKILLVSGAVLLGLLLLAALLVPPIAGAVLRSKVPAALADALAADVTLEDASFRWSGRVVLQGLRVVSRDFREPLLQADRIEALVSLGAALGGTYIADVDVHNLRILVERDAAGRFNHETPPRPPTSSGSGAGSSPPPLVQATVRLRQGVLLIRDGGREARFALDADAKIDSLRKPIAWSAALTDPAGGRISAKGDFDLERRAGPARVDIERLDLGNLGAAASLDLAGRLDGSLDYRLDGLPAFAGKAELRISAVEIRRGGRSFALDPIVLSHEGGLDGKGAGRQVVDIRLGKLIRLGVEAEVLGRSAAKTRLEIDADLALAVAWLRNSGLVPAELAAEGALSLRGTVDAFPLAWNLEARAPRVSLTYEGKPILLEGVVHRSAGTLDDGGSGRATLSMSAGPALRAEITATLGDLFKAPVVDAHLDASSDLAELGRRFGQVLGLKTGLEGSSTLKAAIGAKGRDLRIALTGRTSDLAAIDAAGKRIPLDPAIDLRLDAAWNGETSTATVETLKLGASFATADAKGGLSFAAPFSVKESSFTLAADLAAIGAKLGVVLAEPPALAGRLEARGSYVGERFDVTATASGLKIGTTGPLDATLVQKGTFSLAPGGGLAIEVGELASSAISATLGGAIRKVREPEREGELTLAATLKPAELGKWMPALGLAGEPIPLTATLGLKPDAMTAVGRAELKDLRIGGKTIKAQALAFDLSRKGDDLRATLKSALVEWVEAGYAAKAGLEAELTHSPTSSAGATTLVNLEVVDAKKRTVREPAVTLLHAVDLAPGAYRIRKAELQSGFLRGGLTGTVKTPAGGLVFEKLAGSFTYLPERLGAVAAPWLGGGTLAGAEEKTLTLSLDGPAPPGGLSRMDVDLARYTHTGLTVSGRTTLTLENGVLKTSTPLEVNRGRTELTASVDLREAKEKPQSSLDFRAKEVDANADMAPFLSSINPIFHTVNGAVGGKSTADFRLTWTGAIDPATEDWAKAAGPALRGSGTLAVKDLLITGSPAVALILQALGEGNQLRGELLGTSIKLENGRCEYTNMTLRLARYELRFTGWVGFDKKMELTVEMPLTEGLKRKYPSLERYLGQTLFVPLRGTASSPRLDFEKAIEEAIKRAAPALLEDVLKKLLDRKKK